VATLVLPDGRPVAVTGSADRTVRVWDLDAGHQLDPILPVIDEVTAISVLALSSETTSVMIAGRGIALTSLYPGRMQG
jgi:WD40 repeat protein